MTAGPILSHPVELARVAGSGTHVRFAATEAERQRIAAEYGFLNLNSLAAEALVTIGRRGTIHVEGRVTAELVQACVVTLEPVEQALDEPFSRSFVRTADEVADPPKPGSEIMVDIEADDPPEPIAGPNLDLGPIVLEHFLLGVDPYPRAPGAALPEEAADKDAPESPFAPLARLRRETPGNA